MPDVSIPVNQPENLDIFIPNEQISLTKRDKIIRSLKRPKTLIILFVMFIIFFVGSILFLILVDWIKFGSEATKAFWIEICSQGLNGIFTIVTLITIHSRVVLFIVAIQLLVKNGDTTYYIKKQVLIKKYAKWYDEHDSLSFLLSVTGFWNLTILAQFALNTLMWGFASYDKNGNIVFPMITSYRRPLPILFSFLCIAITSSIISGALIGYKSRKKNQLET